MPTLSFVCFVYTAVTNYGPHRQLRVRSFYTMIIVLYSYHTSSTHRSDLPATDIQGIIYHRRGYWLWSYVNGAELGHDSHSLPSRGTQRKKNGGVASIRWIIQYQTSVYIPGTIWYELNVCMWANQRISAMARKAVETWWTSGHVICMTWFFCWVFPGIALPTINSLLTVVMSHVV